MNDLKEVIAKNLIRLRQDAGLTQLQLAEMLNYSDKAVSKWERAESIPDLRVLIQLAAIYHITLDDIVSEKSEIAVKPKLNLGKKRLLITLLAVGLVWFIATGIFAVVYFITAVARYAWLVFIVAPFVSAVVATVFSVLWGSRLTNAIASSAVVWTLVAMVVVFLAVFSSMENLWLFCIVAAVFQILIVLWFVLRKVK